MAQAALFLWAVSLPYCTSWLYQPDLSKFMRVSKFLAAAQIFTISCENSKILSRLLSVLSLHWKFVHNHCCCPNLAIILTVSKMEAILDFGWGCQYLSIILWEGGGEGGGNGAQAGCPCYRIWRGEWEGGEGGRRREGGVNTSLYWIQPYAYSFHSISLSYISVLLLQPLSICKSSTGTIHMLFCSEIATRNTLCLYFVRWWTIFRIKIGACWWIFF